MLTKGLWGDIMMQSTLTVLIFVGTSCLANPQTTSPQSIDPHELEWQFLKATEAGNLTEVKNLVAKGADLNMVRGNPIISATKGGHVEVVKYLLEVGANPNGTNDDPIYKGYPLTKAAQNNQLEIVNLLLDAGANVVYDEEASSPFLYTTSRGYLEVVKRLLDAGVDPNHGGGYGIRDAAIAGYLEMIKAFISVGADLNVLNGWIIEGAAQHGHLEVVRTLIEGGTRTENLGEALEQAATNGHLDVVNFLLQKGADPNYGSVLKYAAKGGSVDVIRVLLEAGSNNTCEGEDLICPWHQSARWGHPDAISLLVEYGADINKPMVRDNSVDFDSHVWRGGDGWTVLHIAADYGQSMTKQLVDLGANINLQDAKGRTSLQVAIESEHLLAAKDLLLFCPDLTPVNKAGKTALERAKDLTLKNATNAIEFQNLMDALKRVFPQEIASTPFAYPAMYDLRDKILAAVKDNSTLKEELKDFEFNSSSVFESVYRILENRSRENMVKIIEGHQCSEPVAIGTEYVARCDCVPGQGPKMTFTPVQECGPVGAV